MTQASVQSRTEPPAETSLGDPVLRVRNLTTRFRTDDGIITAIDDVSLELYRGETLGIVGESGCGKTVASKSVMRLLPSQTARIDQQSRIEFGGHNLATASDGVMRSVRGKRIAMIFQEPMTSLNPVFRVGWQIEEALKKHTDLGPKRRRERGLEMLKLVEIPNPERRYREYPHQLSGGMRQRVMIAMALCCEPEVLIADEPTTALDVTIQAQILDLLERLRRRTGTAIMLITHDLGVVAQVCDRVVVMYAGRVVETAPCTTALQEPAAPVHQGAARFHPEARQPDQARAEVADDPGDRAEPLNLPAGCRFDTRCASRATRTAASARNPRCMNRPRPAGRAACVSRCFPPIGGEAPLTVSAKERRTRIATARHAEDAWHCLKRRTSSRTSPFAAACSTASRRACTRSTAST